MAQPVWVLSVDLQTKTATFQSGMADAAKSARGAFNEIKQGSGNMAGEVGTNMTEARHGVMLLGEEFGVHLPRALTSFIASIGPVGAAMEAAFPFLAIIVGATLLIEHLAKVKEEEEKLVEAQGKFTTAINNAFNSLDDKLIQAQIRADELRKDHLSALHHELELIDHQSLDDLVHSLDTVAKAADSTFAELKSHIYTQGIAADGAKSALEKFRTEYGLLLSERDDKSAHDLLAGTLDSAEKTLAAIKEVQEYNKHTGERRPDDHSAEEESNRFIAARTLLTQQGLSATKDELTAQEKLVSVLGAALKLEQLNRSVKDAQKSNAETGANRTILDEQSKSLKERMDAERKEQEDEFKLMDESRVVAIAKLEQTEREKIEATEKGSAARLAAIDNALRKEETRGLQDTAFYHSLGVARVATIREMADEAAKLQEQAGKEAAAHDTKMGEIQLAAERERDKLRLSGKRVTVEQLAALEKQYENEDFNLKKAAMDRELAALDKHAKDYENKKKALNDRQEELEREHQNRLTQIDDRAEEERKQHTKAAEDHLQDLYANGLAEVITRHQTFAGMMASIGDQVAQGMIANAIKSMLAMDMAREREAAEAARQGFISGMKFPFPANLVMAPALAASNFAAVMAFEQGGVVPGVGQGDVVPAMLTPGEHVADKELTQGLRDMVRKGKNTEHHFHTTYAPQLQSLDPSKAKNVIDTHARETARVTSKLVTKRIRRLV